jgi:hypothetical protein
MKSTTVIQKSVKRGRPATREGEYDPIMSLRMPLRLRDKVEKWADGQEKKLSVSKAICHLVELGLAAASKSKGDK